MKTAAKPLTSEKLSDCFAYLDALRESGITNMFGASPYLQKAMKIKDRDLGIKILSAWMKTFSHEKSPEVRVQEAIEKTLVPQ